MSMAVADGDEAFLKVDTRTPAHALPPGVCAAAENKRFEDGRAWPRYGAQRQSWGRPEPTGAIVTVPSPYTAAAGFHNPWSNVTVTGLVVGRRYRYEAGNSTRLTTGTQVFSGLTVPAGTDLEEGLFTATTTSLYLWSPAANAGSAVTARLYVVARPRGFRKWDDPEGTENLILLTDDWRDLASEDGGRGRAWRVRSGQAPQAIDLNGHDIYGEARLVPCDNGLLMLRQDLERHYFQASAVDTVTSRIQLNCAPTWVSGDRVFFWADLDFAGGSYIVGTNPPAAATEYWVKVIAGNKAELYSDGPDLATQLDGWTAAHGRFYLEKRSDFPGYYGNGAPPLMMQPDGAGATALENGFEAVATYVFATDFNSTSKLLTVKNHRLIPGDKIVYHHIANPSPNATQSFWVAVINEHKVRLYTSVDLALAGQNSPGSTTNAQTPDGAQGTGDYITKDGASGLAMPPAREGVYYGARVLAVNDKARVSISDPLDPLHYTPFSATLNVNLGESDNITGLTPFGVPDPIGRDIIIVGKENELLALLGLAGASSGWICKEITREYGFGAPLATIRVGNDVWGLGRRGVVSVAQTNNDQRIGVAKPVSYEMQAYENRIDWKFYQQACAESWKNRAFFAVPLKGQSQSDVRNNGVLVYNMLNGGWEGLWTGDFEIYCFARHRVFGEERLVYVDYNGQVGYFSDGYTDGATAISDLLLTRVYTGRGMNGNEPRLWLKAKVTVESQRPKWTVKGVTPGFKEEQTLVSELEYDKTSYNYYGQADYVAGTDDFAQPGREDYALAPAEIGHNGAADVHQNQAEPLRLRLRDWGVQLRVTNSQGSLRITAVEVEGVLGGETMAKQS